jgi:hypothetical protein
MGLPDAKFPGLAVVAVRGEEADIASLERGGFVVEEGSAGLCIGVGATVDADAAG